VVALTITRTGNLWGVAGGPEAQAARVGPRTAPRGRFPPPPGPPGARPCQDRAPGAGQGGACVGRRVGGTGTDEGAGRTHGGNGGETEINGRLPVNTDGGCLANGEPIGASGLRQVYENVLQLRGDAGERQVPNDPKVAYTHVYGAPGISGVTILSR